MQEIKLVLDQDLLDEYNKYYFKKHPKARKAPIEKPWHPSINEWMIMPRPQMNALKQKWKEFGVWWIEKLGYTNMMLDSFEVESTIYFNTNRRHDNDNYQNKGIWDSFTEAGFIVDDDSRHMKSLTLRCEVDKEYPRTEIVFKILDDNKEEPK